MLYFVGNQDGQIHLLLCFDAFSNISNASLLQNRGGIFDFSIVIFVIANDVTVSYYSLNDNIDCEDSGTVTICGAGGGVLGFFSRIRLSSPF
ncbi:hypothetical protein T4D_1896 [Trichinella pseudospiralis]|uniref:Uncharacterized protein n=1 Tax=Trichinella pseudospiralis TaxID=6337 RepID=A0A0V1FSN6_TRIPS|nr:hypothetical protein T4D_1896 [Trichinella pseudospiralis]